MFIATEAKDFLETDRRVYLKKTLKMLEHCINKNNDEAAATCVITAAQELTRIEGAIQYLESLEETKEYPRFNTIFDWE